jgi:hypothetical protein
VLDEEEFVFDDGATGTGGVQELRPGFQAVLLAADVAVRPVVVGGGGPICAGSWWLAGSSDADIALRPFGGGLVRRGNAVGAVGGSEAPVALCPEQLCCQLARKGRKAVRN